MREGCERGKRESGMSDAGEWVRESGMIVAKEWGEWCERVG